MTFTTVGDLARNLMLSHSTNRSKHEIFRLSQALASNLISDIPQSVRGNLTPLSGLETSLKQHDVWALNAKTLASDMEVMQHSLATLRDLGDASAKDYALALHPNTIGIAGMAATSNLEAALAALNVRMEERSLFAGTQSDGPAVTSAATLLSALEAEVAALTSPEDIVARVEQWFADPAGFQQQAYEGGAPRPPLSFGPQRKLSHGVTAADAGLQMVLAGLAIGALVDRGVLGNDYPAQQKMLALGYETLANGARDSAQLTGRLGHTQAQLKQLQARNSASAATLDLARADLLRPDPDKTATDLTAASTQLELLYAMTARLSSLTLLNALR